MDTIQCPAPLVHTCYTRAIHLKCCILICITALWNFFIAATSRSRFFFFFSFFFFFFFFGKGHTVVYFENSTKHYDSLLPPPAPPRQLRKSFACFAKAARSVWSLFLLARAAVDSRRTSFALIHWSFYLFVIFHFFFFFFFFIFT